MTQLPSLAETLTVRPEQLTGLTPVEVDRYNMVLSDEYNRLDEAIDKACDGLYRALLLSKKSVRRGNGYSQVWPISLADAEKLAAEHLATGHEPEQRDRRMHGLTRDGSYAEQLREAVERLASLRAEWKALNEGPKEVLDGEFDSRGGWTRMFLCTADGGHIHTGRRCPSIGPRTHLVWLPDVSGMDWREAYKLVIRDMTAGTEAIMCSKKTCFPDAPVEWTQRQADPKECPGSRQYARLMHPSMARRMSRSAECHVCHTPNVTVTSGGNLRKHDRPEGGEEATPEAPQAPAPAVDKPRDDNRLTVIERTPLKAPEAAEDKPAPAPKGKPGGNPTIVHVASHLNRAGFQLSRYTGRMGDIPAGAKVTRSAIRDTISVMWIEHYDSQDRRRARLGLPDSAVLPPHPDEEQRARDYANALSPRYAVDLHQSHSGRWYVHVSRREELPTRPKGLPGAAAVARAMREDPRVRQEVDVVDQIDHVRVAVGNEDDIAPVREALTANGWTFEEPAPAVEHHLFHITGSAPDRPARLRKLRAQRLAREIDEAGNAAVAKIEAGIEQEKAAQAQRAAEEAAPVGSYVEWAEGPEERTEHGHVVGKRDGEALVMGLDGGFRQMPEDIPEEVPEPVPYAYDSRGRRWQQGQRAEFKTTDLFLYAGEIVGFGEEDGEKTATIRVDTTRAAPASRPMYKGDPNRPGKPRQVDPPEEWTRPLAKLNKPL